MANILVIFRAIFNNSKIVTLCIYDYLLKVINELFQIYFVFKINLLL